MISLPNMKKSYSSQPSAGRGGWTLLGSLSDAFSNVHSPTRRSGSYTRPALAPREFSRRFRGAYRDRAWTPDRERPNNHEPTSQTTENVQTIMSPPTRLQRTSKQSWAHQPDYRERPNNHEPTNQTTENVQTIMSPPTRLQRTSKQSWAHQSDYRECPNNHEPTNQTTENVQTIMSQPTRLRPYFSANHLSRKKYDPTHVYDPGQNYVGHSCRMQCLDHRSFFRWKQTFFRPNSTFPPSTMQCCSKGKASQTVVQHCIGVSEGEGRGEGANIAGIRHKRQGVP